MAIQMGATIYDLEEAELCYAPPFGTGKDPVNFAGMIAANIPEGDMPVCHWDYADKGFLVDVRNPPEVEAEAVPGAINIPLPQLRSIEWVSYQRIRRYWYSAVQLNAPTMPHVF